MWWWGGGGDLAADAARKYAVDEGRRDNGRRRLGTGPAQRKGVHRVQQRYEILVRIFLPPFLEAAPQRYEALSCTPARGTQPCHQKNRGARTSVRRVRATYMAVRGIQWLWDGGMAAVVSV